VHGLTGSGKSTLAAALADKLGAEWLSTDAIRRQMFGASAEPATYGHGHYRPVDRLAVYNALFAAAGQLLTDGLSVVLDGTFLTADLRRQAAHLVRRRGARALFIHCTCPDNVARQRIARRSSVSRDTSESRPEFVDRQKVDEETTTPDLDRIEIDTTRDVADQIAAVIRELNVG
jgi:uncharacterized protein